MRIRFLVATVLLICSYTVMAHAQTPVDKAWGILKQGVSDQNLETRIKAYRGLALAGNSPNAQKMVEAGLSDAKPEVRSAAASALGQMGAKSAIPKLEQAVKDPDASVVFAATDALYRLGSQAAFQVYYAVLLGEKKSGEGLVESQVKMLKDPKALAQTGFEVGIGFIPFAGAGYRGFKAVTKDDSSPLRAAAAVKLAGDPDPKSAQALSKAARDDKWIVRAAVLDAISRRGDPALLKAVVPLLDDENAVVKFSAAGTVVKLSPVKQ